MTEPTAPSAPPDATGGGAAGDYAELRRLLVGPEQRRLDELADRLDTHRPSADDVADILPEAIALRAGRDQRLGRALAPTVQTALRESIRRNPREIAAAIFPVLGPAIRKAIAETMAGLVRSINSAVEHSFTVQGLRWRLESWRTGVPYPEVVIRHALVYRVEQVFLIHAETGLLLAHVTGSGLVVPEADLISGMLTAIQDFVRDSFRPAEGGTLRTFSVGDHTVHVEAGPAALIAAVVRGEAPPELLRRLQYAVESIHLGFAGPLADFTGDAAPFAAAKPLLEECLETVVDTTSSRPGGRAWMRWAVPLLAVLIVALGFATRGAIRFSRARAALEAEPGYLLVTAERGWRGARFGGLRDPLARTPAAVLAAAGLGDMTPGGRWEPYLSLDSGMVVARTLSRSGASPDVSIALRGDTLVLGGRAPIEWLAEVIRRPVEGVGAVDWSGVAIALSPGLDSLRGEVERSRLLFVPGTTDLVGGSGAVLGDVAFAVARLVDGVDRGGGIARLILEGRTDATGTDALNQNLAQARIDRVTARLLAAGVPASALNGDPVATARPLSDPDPAEQARINRSVTFRFAVTIGDRRSRTP